ncbi:MAG: alternative ribosome rescue aminoacyl-tRNA hydrolase ArfB [Planctomycetaceae bacterium]
MLEVNEHIQIADSELNFSFARSGGPGGQNVNKVNSKAVLHWNATESEALPPAVKQRFLDRYANRLTKEGILVLHSQRYRDQAGNIEDCRQRLIQLVLEVVKAPVKRRPTKPGKGAKQRRLQGKKENAQKKQQRQPPRHDD